MFIIMINKRSSGIKTWNRTSDGDLAQNQEGKRVRLFRFSFAADLSGEKSDLPNNREPQLSGSNLRRKCCGRSLTPCRPRRVLDQFLPKWPGSGASGNRAPHHE